MRIHLVLKPFGGALFAGMLGLLIGFTGHFNPLRAQLLPPGQPVVTATPAPPWTPGQTVQFEAVVNGWQELNSNWFHGLGILPGSCWENFQYGPLPAVRYSFSGQWMIWNGAGIFLPGIYFDTNNDGNPRNNFGDGSAGFGSLGGPWTFRWSARVPTCVPDTCDLSMRVKAYADSESGSWGPTPPAFEPVRQGPSDTLFGGFSVSDTLICLSDSVLIRSSDLDTSCSANAGRLRVTFNLTGGVIRSGALDSFYVSWTTPGPKFIIRTRTDTISGATQVDTVNVLVSQPPTADFIISPQQACTNDLLTVTYTGTVNIPQTFFIWNFGGATIVSGSGRGPYQIRYTTPGNKTISLRVFDAACGIAAQDIETQQILINNSPSTDILVQQTGSCVGDTFIFQYNSTDPATVTWDFDAASVIFGSPNGIGPTAVVWNTPGTKTVTINADIPGCGSSSTFDFEINPIPVVVAGPRSLNCTGNTGVTLTPSINVDPATCQFIWTPTAGLSNPNILNPVANPATSTTYFLLATCNGCNSPIDSVRVDMLPRPTASIPAAQLEFCAGTGGVPIPASASGGTGPLRYEWTPSAGLSDANALQPVANPTLTTIYTLVVVDSIGCASEPVPIEVVVNALPIADPGPDTTICEGQTVTLNPAGALPGLIYRWAPATGLSDPNIASPAASPTQTTIYTLTVISAAGCVSPPTTDAQTVVVNISQAPDVVILGTDGAVCELGGCVRLQASIRNAGPNPTFLWSPPTGLDDPTLASPTFCPDDPGVYPYTLRVTTAEGCFLDEFYNLTVNPAVKPVPGVTERLYCPGGAPVVVNPSFLPTPTAYRWRPAAGLNDSTLGTPSASPLQTTVYVLEVEVNGCVTDSAAVFQVNVADNQPIRADGNTPNHQRTFCPGSDPLVLRAMLPSGYSSLEWLAAPGIIGTRTEDTLVVEPTVNTQYVLVAQYEDCSFRDTVTVFVLPALGAAIQASEPAACQGTPVQLQANGGIGSASYWWVPAAGLDNPRSRTPIATPDTTTTFTVYLTEGGCTDSATFTLTITPQPLAHFASSVRTEGCGELLVAFQDQTLRGVTAGGRTLWDFGDGQTTTQPDPVHLYTDTGTFTVTLVVESSNGTCADTFQLVDHVVVRPAPEAAFTSNPTYPADLYLPDATVQFRDSTEGSIQWFWNFGDGRSSTQRNPRYTWQAPGEYTVTLTVTDPAGCIDTVSHGPYRVIAPLLDSIPNVFTPNGDGFNDRFVIRYEGIEAYQLTVFDRWGGVVFEADSPLQSWDGSRKNNGTPAPAGVYFYAVKIGDKLYRGEITLIR